MVSVNSTNMHKSVVDLKKIMLIGNISGLQKPWIEKIICFTNRQKKKKNLKNDPGKIIFQLENLYSTYLTNGKKIKELEGKAKTFFSPLPGQGAGEP